MRRSRICTIIAVVVGLLALVPLPLAAGSGTSAEALQAYKDALCRWQEGDQDAAVRGFEEAAALAPNWGAPNARLGAIYQLQQKEAEAREQYALAQLSSFGDRCGDISEETQRLRAQLMLNEAYIIWLTNEARLAEGQSILVPDPTVSLVARLHSNEMRDQDYFSHTSATAGLTSVQDRFRAIFTYKPRLIGENLSRRWGSQYSLCPEKVLQSHHELMNSPGHRKNIVFPTFEWIGIGISVNSNGDYWITEVFVEPGR